MQSRIITCHHFNSLETCDVSDLVGQLTTNDLLDTLILKNTAYGIDDTRTIKEFLSLRPLYSQLKRVFIYSAHTLTIPAQNALLKILEEPPEFAEIILQTSQPQLLLDTIKSRCLSRYCQQVPTPSPESKQTIWSLASEQTRPQLEESLLLGITQLREKLITSPSPTNLFNLKLLLYGYSLTKKNVNLRLITDYITYTFKK